MAVSSKTEILRAGRERELRQHRAKRIFGLIITLILVGLFVGFLNLPFLQVTKVTFSGRTSVDQSLIKDFASDSLNGRYLGLVPKSSIFFISKKVLVTNLKSRFPSLSDINIAWPDLNTLSLASNDRESKTLWCLMLAANKQCYYLSAEGTIYQLAPSFSSSVIVELQTTRPVGQMGERVITPKALAVTNSFIDYVQNSLTDWPTTGLQYVVTEVKGQNDFTIKLTKKTDPTWSGRLLFNTDQGAEELITNLHSVLGNDKFKIDWQAGAGRLDYLDLRFPGKVFYKFK